MKMMQQLLDLLKRYRLSSLLVVAIWVLCLTPWLPDTPLSEVSLIDKWTHLVMYGGTVGVIWFEYSRCHSRLEGWKLVLLGWLGPIAMSGLLELMQRYCTTNRSGEWLDFAANSLGATLGAGIGLLIYLRVKSEK